MATMNFTFDEMILIAKTLHFIKDAHEGQMYGDRPYWQHPLEVALELEDPTVDEFVGALLHDVVEDTSWTLNDLAVLYNENVISIVAGMSKPEGKNYQEYIQEIAGSGNVGLIRVKLADNRVNARGDKSQMPEDRQARLEKKYAKSIPVLEAALGE